MQRWRRLAVAWIAAVLAAATLSGGAIPALARAQAGDAAGNRRVTANPPKVSEGASIGRYGGRIRLATLSDPRTFNVMIAKETSSTNVLSWLFEGLTETNGVTGEVEPGLAHRWTVSDDGLEWTFYLRQGVYWHDGVELTADDVVFTFDLVYDPAIPNNYRDGLTIAGQPLEYEKIDRYTVRFRLPVVFAPFLRSIAVPIMPRHLLYDPWKAGRFNEMWGIDTPPEQIVGTGPVRMVEYRPGERIVFETNPNYWRVDTEGNPLIYVDGVLLRLTESIETMGLLFENGDSDVYAVRGDEYEHFAAGQEAGGYTLYNAGPTFNSNFIVFNQNVRHVPEPKINWFRNVNFRRAVAHAVDKQSIIDAIYLGRAIPQWGPVSPANTLYVNHNVRTYPYDLDEARRLLEEAGFHRGPDGRLRDPEGHVVRFNLATVAGNSEWEAIGNFLREDLAQLGIEVNFTTLEFNLLVNQLTSGSGWDAIILGLTGGVDPHGGRNVWHSSGGLHMWDMGAHGEQPEWQRRIDEIFDTAATTLDEEERKRLYGEWQALVAEYVPMIYTVSVYSDYAVRNRLQNIHPTAYGGTLHNVEVVWISDR